MKEISLGVVEARFADLVWQNAPITTLELVKLCKNELEWARTTTYTVLKKLCEKGLFRTENGLVTVVLTRDEFYAMQSERFVEDAFRGSLPAFLVAFSSRKKPSERDIQTIRAWLDSYGREEGK